MSGNNCLNFLNNYADLLSANTTISGIRPRPVMFSGIGCTGTVWPATGSQPTDALVNKQTYINPVGVTFGSMYIPGGWQIKLQSGDLNATGLYPEDPSGLPVLVSDVASVSYQTGEESQFLFNNVRNMIPTYPTNPDQSTITDSQWKLEMCTNQISTVVGARHLTSWQQGSVECDTFMSGYCAPVSSTGCAPNSTQPAPLPSHLSPCVCLVEENCNREVFCEPGNTNPNCTNNDAFQEFLPITCFGKQCSEKGYRWRRMISQRCTETLCQQIVNIVGQNILVRGSSTIWCGNKSIPIPTPSASVSPSATDGGEVVLPIYAWILIGVAIFLLFITVPLAVIIYRRNRKKPVFKPKTSKTLSNNSTVSVSSLDEPLFI